MKTMPSVHWFFAVWLREAGIVGENRKTGAIFHWLAAQQDWQVFFWSDFKVTRLEVKSLAISIIDEGQREFLC